MVLSHVSSATFIIITLHFAQYLQYLVQRHCELENIAHRYELN